MTNSIEFKGIWKRFAKGEKFDSLRDLIPMMTRSMFSRRIRQDIQGKEFWALKDVSFEVGAGESMAIIGPNGSGKSTSLKILSRILRPDGGSIKVKGRMGSLIELKAGFHPDLTGRENIYLSGTILGMKKAEIDSKFDAIVEFSEMKDFLDTPVKRYSSGMYARLGFSVAAHVDPEVLIIDEVLSVGDYHFQQRCFDKMREFARKGTSLLFVSHNMTAVSALCSKSLLLFKGESLYLGPTNSAIQKYHSLYDGEARGSGIELLSATLTDAAGRERDTFEPGERLSLTVTLKATTDIPGAHVAVLMHTVDGHPIFDTATSRLLPNGKVTLKQGETATIIFTLDMNLGGNVFLLGLTVTPEIDSVFLYCNPSLKRLVMSAERRSGGIVHLNPKVELLLNRQAKPAASGASVEVWC